MYVYPQYMHDYRGPRRQSNRGKRHGDGHHPFSLSDLTHFTTLNALEATLARFLAQEAAAQGCQAIPLRQLFF